MGKPGSLAVSIPPHLRSGLLVVEDLCIVDRSVSNVHHGHEGGSHGKWSCTLTVWDESPLQLLHPMPNPQPGPHPGPMDKYVIMGTRTLPRQGTNTWECLGY